MKTYNDRVVDATNEWFKDFVESFELWAEGTGYEVDVDYPDGELCAVLSITNFPIDSIMIDVATANWHSGPLRTSEFSEEYSLNFQVVLGFGNLCVDEVRLEALYGAFKDMATDSVDNVWKRFFDRIVELEDALNTQEKARNQQVEKEIEELQERLLKLKSSIRC